MKFIYNFLIRKILRNRKRNILDDKNKIVKRYSINPNYKFLSFGNKNKNKIFYVIQRKIGGGFFSNLLFVMNHLIIANKLKLIPVIDMENFKNFYSEKNKIQNSKNVWEYYFEKISNYDLKEVYKSKNVLISENLPFFGYKYRALSKDKELKKIFYQYIKIKKYINLKSQQIIKKKNINKKEVFGVHWRGTDHKVLPNHPLPPSKEQIFAKVDEILDKKKYSKIFLVTEDPEYLESFKKKYSDKLIFLKSFRSTRISDFSNLMKKNHRYKIGLDSLIEVLILSKLDMLVCSESNISDFVKFISKNKKFKIIRIYNARNTKNILMANFNWKLKNSLPKFLGGF